MSAKGSLLNYEQRNATRTYFEVWFRRYYMVTPVLAACYFVSAMLLVLVTDPWDQEHSGGVDGPIGVVVTLISFPLLTFFMDTAAHKMGLGGIAVLAIANSLLWSVGGLAIWQVVDRVMRHRRKPRAPKSES